MAHRAADKQARREKRQAEDNRRRQIWWRSYAAVAALAVVLVGLAVLLGRSDNQPAFTEGHDGMSGMTQTGGATAEVGKPAPAFKVTDVVSGTTMTAADLRGQKTMLFFSEGVNCQACLVQAADLQKNATLRKAGISLVSVTTDPPELLTEAAKQYGITTPMLADPTMHMSSAYGMLGHGGMGHPTQDGHAFMLVGADGTVLWHQAYQEMYVKPSQLLKDMKGAMSA